jgi:hypothetical protein
MGPAARVEAQPFFQLDNGESENADGDGKSPLLHGAGLVDCRIRHVVGAFPVFPATQHPEPFPPLRVSKQTLQNPTVRIRMQEIVS